MNKYLLVLSPVFLYCNYKSKLYEIKTSVSLPLLFTIFEKYQDILETLTSKYAGFPLILLWEIFAYPNESVFVFKNINRYEYKISHSTYTRSKKLLIELNLIKSINGSSYMKLTVKGKKLINDLIYMLILSELEFVP